MRLFLIACCALLWAAAPARAGLTFCNDTSVSATVALGYKGAQDWTSEGWWEVPAGGCSTIYEGDLPLTHYYWRATNGDEDFPAQDFYFCTSRDVFTIVGDTNCAARGYDREAFSEIAVGSARNVTVRMTGAATPAPVAAPGPEPEPQPAGEGVDLDAVYQSLQGVWHDLGDDNLTMIIRENRIEDRLLGTIVGEGTFTLAQTCEQAEGAGPVMLLTYEELGTKDVCWIILKLDEHELKYLPAWMDEPSRMRRGV